MDHTASNAVSQDYREDLTEPPDCAMAPELAVYFDKLEQRRGAELEPSEILAYCETRGFLDRRRFDFEQLIEEIDMRRLRRSLGPIPQSEWLWFASADVPVYVDRCPRFIGRMNKRTGVSFTFRSYCDSAQCWSHCALRRVEEIALWACRTFVRFERIWYATCAWNEALTNRLSQRQSRKRDGGGLFWLHRRHTDSVHVFASSDLGGRSEPIEGIWLTSEEALQMLVSTVLALPGPRGWRFTGTWKKPSRPKKDSTSFDLGEAPPDLLKEAQEAARRDLEADHGLEPDNLTEIEIEAVWLPLVKGKLEAQWEYRRGPEDEAA